LFLLNYFWCWLCTKVFIADVVSKSPLEEFWRGCSVLKNNEANKNVNFTTFSTWSRTTTLEIWWRFPQPLLPTFFYFLFLFCSDNCSYLNWHINHLTQRRCSVFRNVGLQCFSIVTTKCCKRMIGWVTSLSLVLTLFRPGGGAIVPALMLDFYNFCHKQAKPTKLSDFF